MTIFWWSMLAWFIIAVLLIWGGLRATNDMRQSADVRMAGAFPALFGIALLIVQFIALFVYAIVH